MGFQECYPRSTENIPLDDLQFVPGKRDDDAFHVDWKENASRVLDTRQMLIRRLPIVLAVSWTMIKKAQWLSFVGDKSWLPTPAIDRARCLYDSMFDPLIPFIEETG